MERYKPQAGRLATVFYKGDPIMARPASNRDTSDTEKGETDPDVPPPPKTSRDISSTSMASHSGRTLAWEMMTLELKVDGKVKRLLNNLSGFVEPGQLTALMGASGAGKVGCHTVLSDLVADNPA